MVPAYSQQPRNVSNVNNKGLEYMTDFLTFLTLRSLDIPLIIDFLIKKKIETG